MLCNLICERPLLAFGLHAVSLYVCSKSDKLAFKARVFREYFEEALWVVQDFSKSSSVFKECYKSNFQNCLRVFQE